ncbi:MAG: hypothetical protein ACK4EX_07605 [Thermaurantimonas sp.]|uniref:hypothetical protein n=1 Tax=Thermaurantimonas sp. TaxID=2681568 RepID=UPI00391AF8F3
MKNIIYLFIFSTLIVSCKKIPESQFQCGSMEFTLPTGWSFDFVNNDFTTFSLVDSSWSFSPKSWTGHSATGDEAGAKMVVIISSLKTNNAVKEFVENSDIPEKELLYLFYNEYMEKFKESLENIDPEPVKKKLPSGEWYTLSMKRKDTFEDKPFNEMLVVYCRIFKDNLYLFYFNDFEKLYDKNFSKYFNKILQSVKFV